MIIQHEVVDLATPTGVMRTSIYRPEGEGSYPAVLFYSEIFQETGPITRAARLIAGHGYIVLVPEVFHEYNPIGTALGYDDAGRIKGNDDKGKKPLENYDSDNRVLIAHLATLPYYNGLLGSMGFCIGGHLAFRAALQPEVRASVCFYATDLHSDALPCQPGQQTLDRATEIQGELLMLWGKQDPHIPGSGRAKVYQRLTEYGTNFSWHEFNGQHAFMRDEGERYDAALALTCYRLALDLLARKLR